MATKLQVGERIAEARRDAKLTQEALARQLGCSVRSVAGWEQEKVTPRKGQLERLAAALDRPVSWFFEIETAAA